MNDAPRSVTAATDPASVVRNGFVDMARRLESIEAKLDEMVAFIESLKTALESSPFGALLARR